MLLHWPEVCIAWNGAGSCRPPTQKPLDAAEPFSRRGWGGWEPAQLNRLHGTHQGLLPDYRSRHALLPALLPSCWVLRRPRREGAWSTFSFGLGQAGSGKGGQCCVRMGTRGRGRVLVLL